MRPPAIGLGSTLLAALGLALAPGCDQPTGTVKPRAAVAPAEAPAEPSPPAPAPAPAPVEDRGILGKRTQDIRDAKVESKAGGREASTKIIAKDPITLPGNAYVTMIGRTSQLQIEAAVKLYQGETGEYPKSLDEFMEKIIRPNNIALPKLPKYQDYAYDVDKHSLIIMEYPDRKEAMNYPK